MGLSLLLSACTPPQTPVALPYPPSSTTPTTPRSLGRVEVSFTGLGTQVYASNVRSLDSNINGQALTKVAQGLQLKFNSKGSFDVGTAGSGTRYLYATYNVRNAGMDGVPSPVARSNLTFVAVDASSPETISGTAVRNFKRFDGSGADVTLAPKLIPTVGMTLINGIPTVNASQADFQALTTAEASGIGQPAGVRDVFQYGFVVRNRTGSGRTLSANPGVDQYDGLVTFAVRLPLQANPINDPYSFSLVFEVVEDSANRVTRVPEETVSQAQSRATALGASLVDGTTICRVRVAGPVTSPITTLYDLGVTSTAAGGGNGCYDAGVASLRALATFPIGVGVDGGYEAHSLPSTPAEQKIVEKHFSQVTPGNIMKMSYLHPNQNTYDFAQADELVNYAAAHGIGVHAHTLIWHSDYQVPAFMKSFSGDKAAFLAMLDDHVKNIASHYAGRVQSWDVVNEALNDGGGYRQSLFYQHAGPDYIERAFSAARAADPDALLYYNDYNMESDANKLASLTTMLDGFKARGVPIDGVGFQMHVSMDYPSVNQIEASLKQVVDRGLKVKISELDIPINNPYGSAYQSGDIKTAYTLDLGLAQKKRYCEVVKAYMDTVPASQRGGLVVWGVSDPNSWLIPFLFNNRHDDWPLMFDGRYHDKPALRGVADALTGQACTTSW